MECWSILAEKLLFSCLCFGLSFRTVCVIVQVLCLMNLRGIFFGCENQQRAPTALNYPEGNRCTRLALGVRWFTQAGWVSLLFHCWRGREGKTHRTGYSLRLGTLLVPSVLQAFTCFLVVLTNYEKWSSIDFLLLPESLNPSSLTHAFSFLTSLQLLSTTNLSNFCFFTDDFVGWNTCKASFCYGWCFQWWFKLFF